MTYSVERIESYFGKPLCVLALWQPVATLCVAPDPAHDGEPAKRHETRHWFPYGVLPIYVAIHAAKKFDGDNRDSFTAPRFREALKRTGFYPGENSHHRSPTLPTPSMIASSGSSPAMRCARITFNCGRNPRGRPRCCEAGPW